MNGGRMAMGDTQLPVIAHELLVKVRENVSIDWTIKDTVRAKMRVMVRRILREYGYPLDLCEEVTRPVLEQAERLCAEWAR